MSLGFDVCFILEPSTGWQEIVFLGRENEIVLKVCLEASLYLETRHTFKQHKTNLATLAFHENNTPIYNTAISGTWPPISGNVIPRGMHTLVINTIKRIPGSLGNSTRTVRPFEAKHYDMGYAIRVVYLIRSEGFSLISAANAK